MAKTSVTTSTVLEVALSPRTKAQLRVHLAQYEENRRAIKALEAKQAAIKSTAEKIFVDAGETDALIDGTDCDGFKIKVVAGTRETLNKKKLVTMGCRVEW